LLLGESNFDHFFNVHSGLPLVEASG
jgi:hypothetical protein